MNDDKSKNATEKPTHTCKQSFKTVYSRILDPENNKEDRKLIESIWGISSNHFLKYK